MKQGTKAYIAREGGKIASDLIRVALSRPRKSPAPTEEADELTPVTTAPPEPKITPTPQEPELTPKETVATACVACSLGHFATTAGLLNEAVRFKGEGIASNVIADRIAKSLQELNALERVDLTPEKIRGTPDWERDLAEEALQQSRSLRHRLETLTTIEELEQAAADVEGYYRNLNREWWKLRLAHPELTLDEAKKMAADEAAKEVEARWQSQESNPGKAVPEVGRARPPIIHNAITFDPEAFELIAKEIDVGSAFPEGAKSNLTEEEKATVDRLIEAIPDENDPLAINYWQTMGNKMVYLEGWSDECLAGQGFPDIGGGEWRDKIEFMLKDANKVLIEKQEEKRRPIDVLIPKGRLDLIEGGFREFEAGTRGYLYGATWGVYSKAE